MAVRSVDHYNIDTNCRQRFDACLGIAADAECRAHAQPFGLILCGMRIVARLLDVLDGDQPPQLEGVVDNEHLLDAVLVQQRDHFLVGCVLADRHQPILLGHDVADRIVELLLEAHVAAGDDAHELSAVDYRHARNIPCAGELEHFADGGVGADRERLADHAGLEVLHQPHLRGLMRDAHVLVHDADAAELRHRDRQPRLGDGIHCGRHDRRVELDAAREPGAQVDVVRQYHRMRGHQGDVVEGERFSHDAQHGRLRWGSAPLYVAARVRCLVPVSPAPHQPTPPLPACSASTWPPSSARHRQGPA